MARKARQLMTLPVVSLVALPGFAFVQPRAVQMESVVAPALPFLIVFASGLLTIVLFRRKD